MVFFNNNNGFSMILWYTEEDDVTLSVILLKFKTLSTVHEHNRR